ncbi:hypothetical protein DFH29DRAFT_816849 [Suillus ampliporus]|nr:hypothetical protein DFH29DRAFT_816849 [Suillus ampliporus]
MIDSKAYLLLRHQPWRCFILLLSVCNGYRDLRVHLYNHSGGIVTPCINIDWDPDRFLHTFSCIVFGGLECIGYDPTINPLLAPLPEPIGKIQVNHNYYDILEVIFSSQGLVGHGTVCCLMRRGENEYIIKDHWVLGSKEDVLNEVIMLNNMKGVRGIPELIEHWLVEIAPGEVDKTEKYRYTTMESIEGTFRTHIQLVLKPRARPLHMFRTKAELVSAIRDIVASKYTPCNDIQNFDLPFSSSKDSG